MLISYYRKILLPIIQNFMKKNIILNKEFEVTSIFFIFNITLEIELFFFSSPFVKLLVYIQIRGKVNPPEFNMLRMI